MSDNEVPQWCKDAATEWLTTRSVYRGKDAIIESLAAIIAKHAPQAEKPYKPDFTRTGDVFVSRNGGKWRLSTKQHQPSVVLRDEINDVDVSFNADGTAPWPYESHWITIIRQYDPADALTEQSEQIGLYEATTPPAKPDGSTKWPRYFESADKRGPEYRRIVDGPGERPRWFDGSTSEICSSLSELLSAECIIETDAEGNDLHKLPYTDGIMPTQPIGGEGAKVEVKRYDTSHILRCVDGKILDVPVVKASDHDAAMKAKDENIAWWKATVDMHDERAERAEAEAKALRFSIVSHMGGDDIELDASLDELNAACKKAGQLNYDLGIAKVGAEAEVAELMCEIRDLQATNDDQGDALIAATKRAEQVAAEWERLRKSHEQSEAKRRELVELLEDCTITIGKIHGPQPDELASLNKSIYAALADDAKGGW